MSIIHVDKMDMSLNEIAKITEGELFFSRPVTIKNISLDSREIEEGTLFIAIKGERFDGHDYIGKAFEDGAACIVAERIPYKVKGNVILVDSTLDALHRIAGRHREDVGALTVGITGSVGKTTTKQFISSVLAVKYKTHKTDRNFNNEIGLPLTVLKMPSDADALVLEMGMSFKGEIERLSKTAQPDIAVITNIGTSHIENLGSREGIRDAKLEIRAGLKKDGKLILSGDEPLLFGIDNAIYVGIKNELCDYRAVNLREDVGGTTFDIVKKNGEIFRDLRINIPGMHNVMNASFAYAVGDNCNMTNAEIAKGLLNFEGVEMRQNFYDFEGKTFIEDCYNASAESMKASLSVLANSKKVRGGRSIAVLGNMLELGEYSKDLHVSVGEEAARLEIDKLYLFGTDAGYIGDGAESFGIKPESIKRFSDISSADEIGECLKHELQRGDNVLFKASRGVKLERVIEYLKN